MAPEANVLKRKQRDCFTALAGRGGGGGGGGGKTRARGRGRGPRLLNPSRPAAAQASRASRSHPRTPTARGRRRCWTGPPRDPASGSPPSLPGRLSKEPLKGRTEKVKGTHVLRDAVSGGTCLSSRIVGWPCGRGWDPRGSLAQSARRGDAGKASPRCALHVARGLLPGRCADAVGQVPVLCTPLGVLYGKFSFADCGGRERERERVAVASASWLFVLAPGKDQNNG